MRIRPMSKARWGGNDKKDQPYKLKILSLFHYNMLTLFSRVMYVLEATFHPDYSFLWIWTKILESARPIKDSTITSLHLFRRKYFDDQSSNQEFYDCSMNEDKEVICDESWGQFIDLNEEPKHFLSHVAQ